MYHLSLICYGPNPVVVFSNKAFLINLFYFQELHPPLSHLCSHLFSEKEGVILSSQTMVLVPPHKHNYRSERWQPPWFNRLTMWPILIPVNILLSSLHLQSPGSLNVRSIWTLLPCLCASCKYVSCHSMIVFFILFYGYTFFLISPNCKSRICMILGFCDDF